MEDARVHLLSGGAAPCWFVADEQTAGRGRHGRAWVSPPGNLHATLALLNPCEPASGAELGFVAGLALHRAVADMTRLGGARLGLKWPNDLLLDGAKLAGILLEGTTTRHGFALLIGFGVNSVAAPDDTPYPATALASAGVSAPPAALLPALADAWLDTFALWQAEGFAAIRAVWLRHAAHLGATLTVRPASGAVSGVMEGIDAAGQLLLRTEAGLVTIAAGDISLRPIAH
jgi:BirA family biotin operon repressor/biotin-[acetyl-CoA-carboxylase] ligase